MHTDMVKEIKTELIDGKANDAINDPNVAVQEEPKTLNTSTSEAMERVKPMDLLECAMEEIIEETPWHVRRWVQNVTGQECSTTSLLFASTTSEAISTSCSTLNPKASIGVDARPSSSGVTTSARVARGDTEGSDLDSEFDEEFDGPIENAALTEIGRVNIPDDEELDEPSRQFIGDVERAMDDEADRMLGVSSSFIWNENFGSFKGVPEKFSGPDPGPVRDYDTPYDAFSDIWSEDIIEIVVRETNRYAKQTIDKANADGTMKPRSRLHKWTDTNANEILLLFAVYMFMGIDSRTSLDEYWKSNSYLEMSKFKQLISFNRFVLLNKFLHFVDNSDTSRTYLRYGGVMLSQKLAKLAPVISHLDAKFSSLYNLRREICIDESLTLFNGRLSWAQTVRTKVSRFGIKSYELCESQTGYLYRFQIHTGNSDVCCGDVPPSADLVGKSTKVVLELLKGLEHRGHCVTMDNFYNCPSLARYLKSLGFDCLGTLRLNRRHVPDDISKAPDNVARGTIIARQCGDLSVIAWKDTKLVTLISTYHTNETYVGSRAGRALVKPVCVRDYGNAMGGVYLKDHKLSMYLLERKRGASVKWYIKIFKRLLNVSIYNAFVMYTKSLERRNEPSMNHREFRYKLASSLVDQHRPGIRKSTEPMGMLMRLRQDVVHCPKSVAGIKNRKRCMICQNQGRKNKYVYTQCVTCGVYLCFENCWREWHSLPELEEKKPRARKRKRDE